MVTGDNLSPTLSKGGKIVFVMTGAVIDHTARGGKGLAKLDPDNLGKKLLKHLRLCVNAKAGPASGPRDLSKAVPHSSGPRG